MHNMHEDLTHIFVEPIGFTVESISGDIVVKYYYEFLKCLVKWSEKEYNFSLCTFWDTSWKDFIIFS